MESHGSGFAQSLFNVGPKEPPRLDPGYRPLALGVGRYRAALGGVRY